MGKALAEAFPVCRATFAEADEALRMPLSRLCFEGPESELLLTENTQPALLTMEMAVYRLLVGRHVSPAWMAGHSLGEYTAHVAAGTVSFADALQIVRRRGQVHAGGGARGRRGDGGRVRPGRADRGAGVLGGGAG